MSDPLVTPEDLGVYLNDPGIDTIRATNFIEDAQILCESVITPLPATATVVVKRMAGRGYLGVVSPRQAQLEAAGGIVARGALSGVFLTRYDEADLRRLNAGGGAFSIDLLPAAYTAPASWTVMSDDEAWA